MAIEGIVKKWGNSMGVLIPKEVVEREKIKINEKIIFNIVKKADLTNIFGAIEKKNILFYAQIVNLLIGINQPERRNNFLSSITPAYVTMHLKPQ